MRYVKNRPHLFVSGQPLSIAITIIISIFITVVLRHIKLDGNWLWLWNCGIIEIIMGIILSIIGDFFEHCSKA